MNLSGLLEAVDGLASYQRLVALLAGEPRSARLSVVDSAKPYLLAALQRSLGRPLLVVVAQAGRARELVEQVQAFAVRPEVVAHLPEHDSLFFERLLADSPSVRQRLTALALLSEADAPVVVASIRALMHRVLPPDEFRRACQTIRVGAVVRPEDLLARWLSLGYQSAALVDEPGTFGRRGGIVDVFPVGWSSPARLEFFGDEVESVRLFDPATQRSQQPIEAIQVLPAHEVLPSLGVSDELRQLDVTALREEARGRWRREVERLAEGQCFEGVEFYAPYLRSGPVLEHLPSTGLIVLDEPAQLRSAAEALVKQAEELRAQLVERGELPDGFLAPYLSWEDLAVRLRGSVGLELAWQEGSGGDLVALGEAFRPVLPYGGRLKTALDDARAANGAGKTVVVVTRQARRLEELLAERDVYVGAVSDVRQLPPAGALVLVDGSLSEGFGIAEDGEGDRQDGPGAAGGEAAAPPRSHGGLAARRSGQSQTEAGSVHYGATALRVARGAGGSTPEREGRYAGLWVLTDREIFGWSKPGRAPRPRLASRQAFLADLEVGDYVVHVEHGVGRYLGLTRLAPDGVERAYLIVEYAAGDRLYVPADQADRVSRYVGPGDTAPALNRLGTTDWVKTKARVRAAVQQMAEELLELYAARQVKPGHGFSEDTPWQADVEASFPYVETPDQIEAMREIKADMERPKPMDRLLCGDVGYGKTEVAIRAAFKAVMDGKQVAVLVPTTVLAQQHFNTFKERLQAFPVRIEMLSRFLSEKEQQKVVADLKAGAVDICVGTHRLIQKDVEFRDLGLVVVDEEQRFGVAHKERLKQLRREVDVLTLSATPIPRTLHMALVGVRDMSTMDTPPEDRLPIRTYVAEYDEGLIREAIVREVDRGGQVYFVHNRVQTIQQVASRLGDLVPEVTIAIGHGQMPEEQLERVMLDFAAGRYDVLVCSTIIESGLDIPNVNTIIVNRADMFGLAQLYQLRGRVGRGANRAYAYFLYPRGRQLSEVAEKRLRTIFEATELGAGFRIAMKDLEIRGAGNLLGPEQHGHVAAVGFHLYCQLLGEAVKRLRGEEAKPPPSVAVDLPLSAYLPDAYVEDETARLNLYQRLAAVADLDALGSLTLEMRDRFGPPPEPALSLLYVVQLRCLAAQAGVEALTVDDGDIVVRLSDPGRLDRARLERLFGDRLQVGRSQLRLSQRGRGAHWREALQQVLEALGEGARASAGGRR